MSLQPAAGVDWGEWEQELSRVEQLLDQSLASEIELIPQVAGYLLHSGGKRIRPLILLLAARLFDYRGDTQYELAACLELIHTATLLHDDVVDEAKVRRGATSANNVFGNATVILVGDFLFSRSFEIMLRGSDLRILRAMAAMTSKMAEGEAFQMTVNNRGGTTREDYLRIIESKTAILFSTAARFGAMVAERARDEEDALAEYGRRLGMAFQIVDDALDFEADESKWGKALGKDLEEGKITLPLIEALERAPADEGEKILGFVTELASAGDPHPAALIKPVITFVRRYGGIGEALKLGREYIEVAKSQLERFEDSEAKRRLIQVADFVLDRQF